MAANDWTEIQLVRGESPPSEERLARFEAIVGAPLPSDYRTFLRTRNGGQPQPNRFRFGDDAYEDSCVDFFASLYDGEFHNLEDYFKRNCLPGRRRIPEELIPIGYDPGGSLICLAVRGERRGAVFFWDLHGYEDDGEPPWDNVHLIGRSFADFLASLH